MSFTGQDITEAALYLAVLTGVPSAAETVAIDWRALPDNKKNSALKAENRRGTLAECWEWLVEKNAAGHGIFNLVNATDGRDVKTENVKTIRAAFVDDDTQSIGFEELVPLCGACPPTLTVQSSHGQHNYFLLAPGEDVTDFTPLQVALAAKFGTDKKIKDLPRVMRTPGFLHLKDPSDPFLVYVYQTGGFGNAALGTTDGEEDKIRRYTVQEIVDALSIPVGEDEAAPREMPAIFRDALNAATGGKSSFAGIEHGGYAPRAERIARAKQYLAHVPPAVQGKGGDAHTLQACIYAVCDFDLDDEGAEDALSQWNARCVPPWEPADLAAKITNARRYSRGSFGSKLADPSRRPGGVRSDAGAAESAPVVGEYVAPAVDGDGNPVADLREPWPEWTNDQKSAMRGPLVNYTERKKRTAEEVDETSELSLAAAAVAESQADLDSAKTQKEWVQMPPSSDKIAQAAPLLVRYVHHKCIAAGGATVKHFHVDARNLAISSSEGALKAEIAKLCKAMQGGHEPTPETITTATNTVMYRPTLIELPLFRWAGETHLARHEMPVPVDSGAGDVAGGGDGAGWSAWKEFTDRLSDADTFMAWVWTCFLPEEHTGREALLLFGDGNDGKSYVAETLLKVFGPIGAPSELLTSENRFQLAHLVDKRLVYFGDVRSHNPLKGSAMREIISGAHLAYERKGKDVESARFHPRVLISTNVEPRIGNGEKDRAEWKRVRRINVRALPENMNKGDSTWPHRLLTEFPAFLYQCWWAYDRLMKDRPNQDLPITDKCQSAMEGSARAIDDDFEFLSTRLEFVSESDERKDSFVSVQAMTELFDKARYSKFERDDAKKWLESRGASRFEDDKKTHARRYINKKQERVWLGVRKTAGGSVFGEIGTAKAK